MSNPEPPRPMERGAGHPPAVPPMTRQAELIQEIAREIAVAASEAGDWMSCTLSVRRLVPYEEARLEVTPRSGDPTTVFPPDSTVGQIKELRDVMYRPGAGTWFSIKLNVANEGAETAVDVSFDYDDMPAWEGEPASALYVRDLRKYPREEHTPGWLREKIDQARIEYPKAFGS